LHLGFFYVHPWVKEDGEKRNQATSSEYSSTFFVNLAEIINLKATVFKVKGQALETKENSSVLNVLKEFLNLNIKSQSC
jgi:hypothetical protein